MREVPVMSGGKKRTEFDEGVAPRQIPERDEERGVVPREIPDRESGGGNEGDGGKSKEGK